MSRAEQVMLTYFESKGDYIAFKLRYRVETRKNSNGYKNSEVNVYDAQGNLCCHEGKPSTITIGRTFDASDTPIYRIGWLNVSNGSGKYHRPAFEGPATIRASRVDGERRIIFNFYENNKEVIADRSQCKIYIESHRNAHAKATGIAYEKFQTLFRA
jgi:hypothetical protein